MAQPDIKPAYLYTGKKLRLKVKGQCPKKAAQLSGPNNDAQWKQQWNLESLAGLHAAVEAFCQQGVCSLPGAVMLSPWREEKYDAIAFQQVMAQQEAAADLQQTPQDQQLQQQPAKRRVRKRRAPDADQVADAVADQQQQLGWGGTKRLRSAHHRAARDTAHLSNSIHDMLHPSSAPGSPSIVSHPPVAAEPVAAGPAGQVAPALIGSNSVTGKPAGLARQRSRLQNTLQVGSAPMQKPSAAVAESAAVVKAAVPPVTVAAVPDIPAPMDLDTQPAAAQPELQQVSELQTVAPAAEEPAAEELLRQSSKELQVQPEQQVQQAPLQEALPTQSARTLEPKQAPESPSRQQQPVKVQQKQPADTVLQQQPKRQRVERQTGVTKDVPQPKQPTVQQKQTADAVATQQPQPAGSKAAQAQQRKPLGVVVQRQQAKAKQAPVQQKQMSARQRQPAESWQKKRQRSPVAEAKLAQPQQQQQTMQDAQQVLPQQAKPELVQQPTANVVQPAAEAAAVADQVLKPSSPPSETSHQQRIAPQHMQQLLPKAELHHPDKQQQQQQQQGFVGPADDIPQRQQPQQQVEQTALSRDRSQCSLPRADVARSTAAVNMPAPPAVPAVASEHVTASSRLLELAAGSMTPAAAALAALSSVPEVKQRGLPVEGVGRTQEEAMQYLARMMEKAKQLKHQGDKRQRSVGAWDVFGLSFYALSTVEFLLYWDTAQRFVDRLGAARQPVERLQQQVSNLSNSQFLRQTGALSTTGMNYCSNCKGPDVAKQALRMLLERLSAISNMRNLHNQRKQLEGHIRLLKFNGGSIGSSSGNGPARLQQQQQAQQGRLQVQAQRAAAAAAVGKPPSPGGGSWSPAGQQSFNKRSPEDSNASNQERVQLPVGADQLATAAGTAGAAPAVAAGHAAGMQAERALHLAKSERLLMDSMQELLRMTDGMNQTVMRMQQFLESPEVLSNEHARAAALHISVLGLDAGMFSIPRVAAHTEAAVVCITKLLRSS